MPVLWQSVHILQKRGRFYLPHFKQMFLLDGKENKTDFSQDDLDRTRLIAHLLRNWGLVKLKTNIIINKDVDVDVVVISYAEKELWELKSKYSIGKKKREVNDYDSEEKGD